MQEKSSGNTSAFRENLNLLKKTGSDSSLTQIKTGRKIVHFLRSSLVKAEVEVTKK
jgi:hypothetical protein